MKRIICMLLVLALITGMMPVNVWAEESVASESVAAEVTETTEQIDETTAVSESTSTDEFTETVEMVEQIDETTVPLESDSTDESTETIETTERIDETTAISETNNYAIINADVVTTAENTTSGEAFYKSGTCGDSLTWTLDNLGTLTISGIGSMTEYSSDSEAPWYEYSESITELIICDNVTNLSRYGFRYFEKLEKIYFNATAMNDLRYSGIFYRTGADSPSVTVVIGANVTRIPSNLFSNGHYIPEWDASWNCNGVTSVIFEEGSKCESIGNNAFSYCYSLNSIAIPESVTSIGNYAFFDCKNLLIQIEASALPETLGSYWNYGAATCMNVVKFGVTDYGQDYWITDDNTAHVWKYRGDDTTVVIPKTIEGVPVIEIATSAFAVAINRPHLDSNGKITYVDIPNSVTTISSFAFANCVGLEKIVIPESVEYIGYSAFNGCINAAEICFDAIAVDNLESDNRVFRGLGENVDGVIVTIGSKVTQIPNYLFYDKSVDDAPNLTTVEFEEGSECERIGECAFKGCTGLTYIKIPEKVTTVGSGAFSGCTGLIAIDFSAVAMEDLHGGGSAYPDAFARAGTDGGGVVVTIGKNVTYIPENLFKSPTSRCAKITEVIFEDDSQCTSIGSDAFYGCAYLASISIPESVVNFGSSVFAECSKLITAGPAGNGYNIEFSWKNSIPARAFSFSSLTEINIPDSVNSIGGYAFAYCRGLSSIDLPVELIAIGETSFIGCSSLLGITIPEKVITIGDEAFSYCTNLNEIEFNAIAMNDLVQYSGIFAYAGNAGDGISVSIGADVTKIPAFLFTADGFSHHPKINSVTFEQGSKCESIGRNAFSDLSFVVEIEIPDSVTSIGSYAFRNCTALANIIVPGSVTSIDTNVFYGCSGLITAGPVDGGYNYEFGWGNTIPENAFYSCTSLKEVTLPDSISEIGGYAFYKCTGLTEVSIPTNVTNLGMYSFYGCTNVEKLNFNTTAMDNLENSNYVFGNLGKGTNGVTVTVGANVTRIPNYLFCPYVSDKGDVSSSPNVTKVVFEEDSSCYRIGSYAFYGCRKLTDVEIPDCVTVIGAYAFNGCPIKTVTSITASSVGAYAFYGCTNIISVILTNSATSIGEYAFYGTGLTSVTIPVSVTVIEDYAFGDISTLKDVYYGGSEAQWEAIEIGKGNGSLNKATIHYNCDIPDTSDGNSEVCYFFKWDAENQIAYFDTDPEEDFLNFGSQVTDETDTSFLKNVDALVGTYVLVKTQARDDGMLLPDTLISIKPLETYIGIVTAISTTDDSITIDGTIYSYTFDWLETVPEVGDYVKYHLYEDTIVLLEIVEGSSSKTVRYFYRCDEENKTVTFGRDVQSMALVTDNTDTSFLDELDNLLGTYVLVEVNVVDDDAELSSITEIESRVGTVSEINGDTVKINGEEYVVVADALAGVSVNDLIIFHIYKDEIIATEILQNLTGNLVGWDNGTREISIELDASNDSADSYLLSDLADNETLEFLNTLSSGTTSLVTAIILMCDAQGLVYKVHDARCGDNLTWMLDNEGTLTIKGTGDMYDYSKSELPPWYKLCNSIKNVVVEEGVTRIGSYAFGSEALSYYSFETITLPESLSEIGEDAFFLCNDIKRICFGGNRECWEELRKGHDVLKYGKAVIFYNGLSADVWGFDNNHNYLSDPSEGRYISTDDYLKVTQFLDYTDRESFTYNSNDVSYYNIGSSMTSNCEKFAGFCHGLSSWVCLKQQAVLATDDIGVDSDTLLGCSLSADVESAIDYYYGQQYIDKIQSLVKKFTFRFAVDRQEAQISSLESLGKTAEEKGILFLVNYQWYEIENGNVNAAKPYAHSVVGYGWEKLKQTKNFSEDDPNNPYDYQYRILIYDCEDPDQTKDVNIYYNDDGIWCIPGRKIVSTSSNKRDKVGNNGELVLATNLSSDINAVNYKNSATYTDEDTEYLIRMITSSDARYVLNWGTESAEISGFSVENADENGISVGLAANVTADGEYHASTATAFLPNDAENYTVKSEDSEMAYVFRTDHYYTNAIMASSGSITFSIDGNVDLQADIATDFKVKLVADDGYYDLPWYKVEISGVNATEISTKKTADGIQVHCDNMDGITIAVTDDDGTTEITARSGQNSILISQNNGALAVFEDTDGDGAYETDITTEHVYGEWYTVTEADCTTVGEQRRDCTDCDHYQTRVVNAYGHSYEMAVVKPTCTEQGYTTHTCIRCGDTYIDTYVAVTGHSFGEWTETKAPTYIETGEEIRVCHCGEIESRVIESLGNDEEDSKEETSTAEETTAATQNSSASVTEEPATGDDGKDIFWSIWFIVFTAGAMGSMIFFKKCKKK